MDINSGQLSSDFSAGISSDVWTIFSACDFKYFDHCAAGVSLWLSDVKTKYEREKQNDAADYAAVLGKQSDPAVRMDHHSSNQRCAEWSFAKDWTHRQAFETFI